MTQVTPTLQALVVDDDKAFRTLLTVLLEKKGYSVVQASGGRDALKMLSSNMVNVVFSDLQMPEGNGIEFCQEAKRLWPNLPIFLMSGMLFYDLDPTIQATGFFRKPLLINELSNLLEKQLEQIILDHSSLA